MSAHDEPPAQTRRQLIEALLVMGPWTFDDLRIELKLSARDVETELGHIARTVKARGEHLDIRSAECRSCGKEIPPRKERPFHAARRCPFCKAERVKPPAFSIAARD